MASRVPSTSANYYKKIDFTSESAAASAVNRISKDYPKMVIKRVGSRVFYPPDILTAHYIDKLTKSVN